MMQREIKTNNCRSTKDDLENHENSFPPSHLKQWKNLKQNDASGWRESRKSKSETQVD